MQPRDLFGQRHSDRGNIKHKRVQFALVIQSLHCDLFQAACKGDALDGPMGQNLLLGLHVNDEQLMCPADAVDGRILDIDMWTFALRALAVTRGHKVLCLHLIFAYEPTNQPKKMSSVQDVKAAVENEKPLCHSCDKQCELHACVKCKFRYCSEHLGGHACQKQQRRLRVFQHSSEENPVKLV